MSKKLQITAGIVLGVIIIAAAVIWYLYASVKVNKDVTFAAFVQETSLEVKKDTVSLKGTNDADYKPVSGKITLAQGDSVKTDPAGEAIITWPDDSVTRLAPGSEIQITELTIDKNDPTNSDIKYNLFNGKVWNKAMNIVNDKASYSMQSGNVVAGIRGTVFDFERQGCNVTMHVFEHAVNLPNQDVDVVDGEQVTLQENCNGNENDNVNASQSGPIVEEIDPKYLESEWVTENESQDDTYDRELKKELLDQIKSDLGKNDDSLQSFKTQQAADSTTDPQEKAQILFFLAKQHLYAGIIAYTEGDTGKGSNEVSLYQNTLVKLNDVLNGISDSGFVDSMEAKIKALNLLWLKYTRILFGEEKTLTDLFETLALDASGDDREALEAVLRTRNFFLMSDGLENGQSAQQLEQLLQQYNELLAKLATQGLKTYECRILQRISKKLAQLGVSVPTEFQCTIGNANDNTNGNINGNANDNSNTNENSNDNANENLNNNNTTSNRNANVRPNTNVNRRTPPNANTKPPVDEAALLNKLQGQAAGLSCESASLASQLNGILSQGTSLSVANKAALKSSVSAKAASCKSVLQSAIADLEKELNSVINQIEGLDPGQLTGPVGTGLKGQRSSIEGKIGALRSIVNSLTGF